MKLKQSKSKSTIEKSNHETKSSFIFTNFILMICMILKK